MAPTSGNRSGISSVWKVFFIILLISAGKYTYSQIISNRIEYGNAFTAPVMIQVGGISFVGDSAWCLAAAPFLEANLSRFSTQLRQQTPFGTGSGSTLFVYRSAPGRAASNVGIGQENKYAEPCSPVLYWGLDTALFLQKVYAHILSREWDIYFAGGNPRLIHPGALKSACMDFIMYRWSEKDHYHFIHHNDIYIQYKALLYFVASSGDKYLPYLLRLLRKYGIEESLEMMYRKEYAAVREDLAAFIRQHIRLPHTDTVKGQAGTAGYRHHRFYLQRDGSRLKKVRHIYQPVYRPDVYAGEYPRLLREDTATVAYIHPYKGSLHLFLAPKTKHGTARKYDLKCLDAQVLSYSAKEVHYTGLNDRHEIRYYTLLLPSGKVRSSLHREEQAEDTAPLAVPSGPAFRYFGWQQQPHSYTGRLLTDSLQPVPAATDTGGTAATLQPLRLRAVKSSVSVDVVSREFLQHYQPYDLQFGNFNTPRLSATAGYTVTDLLENHQFDIAYRLPFQLNGSEYYISFINRKQRTDWGISLTRRVRLIDDNNNAPWQDSNQRLYPSYAKIKTWQLNLFAAQPLSYQLTWVSQLSLNRNTVWFPSIESYSHTYPAVSRYDMIGNTALQYKLNNDKELEVFRQHLESKLSLDLITALPGLSYITAGLEADVRYKTLLSHRWILEIRNQAGYSFGSRQLLYRFAETENNVIVHSNDTARWGQALPYSFQKIKHHLRGVENNLYGGSSFNLLNIDLTTTELSRFLNRDLRIRFLNRLRIGVLYDNLVYTNQFNSIAWVHTAGFSIETRLSNKRIGINVACPLQHISKPLFNLYIR